MITEERKAQLRRELTPACYKKLASAAVNICKGMVWVRGRTMPKGFQPKDILHNALAELYSGRREWPEHVELTACVIMVMRSIATHLAISPYNTEPSADRKKNLPEPPLRVEVPRGGHEATHPFWTHEDEKELRAEAGAACRGHPDREAIVDAIDRGAESAADVMEITGLPPKRVYNGIKALKRNLQPVLFRIRRKQDRAAPEAPRGATHEQSQVAGPASTEPLRGAGEHGAGASPGAGGAGRPPA